MESRRRTIPVASGYWRNPFIGTGADKDKQGNKSKCKKDTKTFSIPASYFLNSHFEPYPVVKFSNIYSEENYDYLYRSAKKYLKLLGKEIEIAPDGYDFTKLFRYFDSMLPGYQECELCRQNDTIYFHVIENRAGWELYYVPCGIIDRVDAELSEMLLDFFCLLHHTQGLTHLKEDPVYQLFISDTKHYALKEEKERKDLADEYEKGHIGQILDKMAKVPVVSIRKLKNRIKKYNPCPQEAGIIALMLEGLELFGKKEKIIDFGFFPFESDDYYNCYYPVEVHRTLMIVYEEDPLYKFIAEWINEEANEQSAEIFSGGNLLITPKTRKPLKVNPYVNDFFNWLKRFENELHDM